MNCILLKNVILEVLNPLVQVLCGRFRLTMCHSCTAGSFFVKPFDIFWRKNYQKNSQAYDVSVSSTKDQLISKCQLQKFFQEDKGQLILKCIFGVFNSPKRWMKTICSSKVELSLGELKTPKIHFKIKWPLSSASWKNFCNNLSFSEFQVKRTDTEISIYLAL